MFERITTSMLQGSASTSCVIVESHTTGSMSPRLDILVNLLAGKEHRLSLRSTISKLPRRITAQTDPDGVTQITDDASISCQIPTEAPPGSSVDVVYCNMLIRFSQLSSYVIKHLSSADAFQRPTGEIIHIVTTLDQELRTLKESMKYLFCVDAPIDPSALPSFITLNQALHLQFAYYNLLSDIHTTLTYPWSQAMLQPTDNPDHQKQVDLSVSIVADAARALILATKWVHLDANTPIL